MKYIIIILLLFASCGYEIEQTGEGLVKVDIALTFIQEIKELCRDSYLVQDFETIELYNQAVANCVLEILDNLNLSWLNDLYGEEL